MNHPSSAPAPDRFRAALACGPILLDAAMGTRLIARGLDLARDDPAAWAVDRPDDVLDLHRRDLAAGADAILTDTFGASRPGLARLGRGGQAAAINRAAAALARRAAGPDRLVLGSIGPAASDDPAALVDQARALIEAGVDALLLETHTIDQAERALTLLGPLSARPILASLHAWPDSGPVAVADAARRLEAAGAAAIGANCLIGMATALGLARRLRDASDLPLLFKPAAGLPGSPPEPPEAFEAAVADLLALGVRLLGGCCGTTEAHVAALRRGIDAATIGPTGG